jgi:hypothetical protein
VIGGVQPRRVEHVSEPTSSTGCIQDLSRTNDLLTEIATEVERRTQVHLPPKHLAQLLPHGSHGEEPNPVAWSEFNQHVDIALRTEIAAEHGAKLRERQDSVPTAEVCNTIVRLVV